MFSFKTTTNSSFHLSYFLISLCSNQNVINIHSNDSCLTFISQHIGRDLFHCSNITNCWKLYVYVYCIIDCISTKNVTLLSFPLCSICCTLMLHMYVYIYITNVFIIQIGHLLLSMWMMLVLHQ